METKKSNYLTGKGRRKGDREQEKTISLEIGNWVGGVRVREREEKSGAGGIATGIFTDVYLCDVCGYPSFHTPKKSSD